MSDRPVQIDAITVCHNYADMLAITLPQNRQWFGRFVVVASPDDLSTHEVARMYGAELVMFDGFGTPGSPENTRQGAPTWNKGVAVNAGLAALGASAFVAILDSDVLIPRDFCHARTRLDTLCEPDYAIYGCGRVDICNASDLGLFIARPDRAAETLEQVRSIVGVGYFQLFRNARQQYPVDVPHAGRSDWLFAKQFRRIVNLPMVVGHLYHGEHRINWHGRVSASQWGNLEARQVEDSVVPTVQDWQRMGRDPAYRSFVGGKRAIIVGPSGRVTGCGRGAEIDTYDLVVRMNNGLQSLEAMAQDVGSRCDILYHNEKLEENPLDAGAMRRAGVQWVASVHNRASRVSSHPGAFNEFTGKFVRWCDRNRFDRHIPCYETYDRLSRQVGHPGAALSAVCDLLRHDVGSVTTWGVDLHASGYHASYRPVLASADAEESRRVVRQWHDLDRQRNFMARLAKLDQRFQPGSDLQEVLHAS
jgi:hypothetical protein